MDPAPGNLVAVGIDLASVSQVRRSLRDFGDRYLHRVYTPTEIADCCASHDPAPGLAARFAAKEATIKALMVEDRPAPVEIYRGAAPSLGMVRDPPHG